MGSGDTEAGGGGRSFPQTRWTLVARLGEASGDDRLVILNALISRYWKPAYCYARRRGFGNEQAKDLVQEFFASWLTKKAFEQADPAAGRFRSFLLSSLRNFLANARRDEHAAKRYPSKGFVSVHQLASDCAGYEPPDEDTPERAFHRAWLSDLLARVLDAFEEECRTSGKRDHFELFLRRIVQPAREGSQAPQLAELAAGLGLSEKEASNRLITARRAVQRLLREEIRSFTASEEEEAEEVRDLFAFLAGS